MVDVGAGVGCIVVLWFIMCFLLAWLFGDLQFRCFVSYCLGSYCCALIGWYVVFVD